MLNFCNFSVTFLIVFFFAFLLFYANIHGPLSPLLLIQQYFMGKKWGCINTILVPGIRAHLEKNMNRILAHYPILNRYIHFYRN